jgi:hypothetical protein
VLRMTRVWTGQHSTDRRIQRSIPRTQRVLVVRVPLKLTFFESWQCIWRSLNVLRHCAWCIGQHGLQLQRLEVRAPRLRGRGRRRAGRRRCSGLQHSTGRVQCATCSSHRCAARPCGHHGC